MTDTTQDRPPSLILQMARQCEALFVEFDRIDEMSFDNRSDAGDRACADLLAAIDGFQDAIAAMPAQSVADATIQLMYARGVLAIAISSKELDPAVYRRGYALVDSALARLAQLCSPSLDLEALGARRFSNLDGLQSFRVLGEPS